MYHQISSLSSEVSFLCTKYANLFKDELGTVNSHKATIQVNVGVIPKFHKTRPVPYRLEYEGILIKANHSTWAAKVVAVLKNMAITYLCRLKGIIVNKSVDVD